MNRAIINQSRDQSVIDITGTGSPFALVDLSTCSDVSDTSMTSGDASMSSASFSHVPPGMSAMLCLSPVQAVDDDSM